MNTKLTLTLEKEVIEKAKKYASERGRSLSDLVENYFKFITGQQENANFQASSKVKKLRGILKTEKNIDYKKVIEEEINKKYNG